jgi:hypothetical protein
MAIVAEPEKCTTHVEGTCGTASVKCSQWQADMIDEELSRLSIGGQRGIRGKLPERVRNGGHHKKSAVV